MPGSDEVFTGEIVTLGSRDGRTYSLREVCVIVGEDATLVIEMVSFGVIDARGARPDDWSFDEQALFRSKKALRLRRDLGIDWAGLALALDLLDEVERLRARVAALSRGDVGP